MFVNVNRDKKIDININNPLLNSPRTHSFLHPYSFTQLNVEGKEKFIYALYDNLKYYLTIITIDDEFCS